MLKKNIQSLNCKIKTEIISKDVFKLENINIKIKNFEIIFLDPPFKEIKIDILLNIIKKKKNIKKKWYNIAS